MQCPRCGQETLASSNVCTACGESLTTRPQPKVAAGVLTPPPTESPRRTEPPIDGPGAAAAGPPASDDVTRWLPDDGSEPTRAVSPTAPDGSSSATHSAFGRVTGTGPLHTGQNFGARYHIIKLLGAGGMGAVYQGWDDELGMAIALKVIRPEIAEDPEAAEELERRFKRELVLARQVTHKNVVRIHDLGQIDGIKYITMPYIHGADLATILRRQGRLSAPRTLAIARQIAAGLVAAHEAGVVHRDLKPANIMIADDDQACITDFGIARSTAGGAHTTGVVVGTLEYMAPEQASGKAVDQRADVYAFGLILRDMLVGKRHGTSGDSAVAELMQRMHQAPPLLRTLDPTIPEGLEQIVARCLAPEPLARYQTSAQLAADLARLAADGCAIVQAPAPALTGLRRFIPRRADPLAWAVALIVLMIAIALGWRVARRPAAAPPGEPVSLAIIPFRNASGDATLDALGTSLAEILRSELGQSAYLRTVPSDRLRQVLRDLHLSPDSEFDVGTLRRLGQFSSAQTIVWGQYLKIGNQIQVLATLQDLRDNGGTATLKAEAASQGALLAAVDQLAGQVRERLAGSPEILKRLTAASFKPSSQSFQALRDYSEGLDLVRQGNQAEAVKRFTRATEEDADFAVAYSKLAQAYAALGYDTEAERFSRKAMSLGERLPAQEKYLIQAIDASIRHDTAKAVAAYENLAKALPDDPTILFDLGTLHERAAELAAARDAFAKALQRDPKFFDALLANGRILIRLQKSEEALDYLNRALSLSIQLENETGHANVLQAIGIAYEQLDKPADALRYFRESLEIKRRLGLKPGIASSLIEIANIQRSLGQGPEAIVGFTEALKLRREIGDKNGTAMVLIDSASFYKELGRLDEALANLKEALQIEREVGNEQLSALSLNGIGTVYLEKGQFEDAVTYFDRALEIREKVKVDGDTADTLHSLAETSAKIGQYDKSLLQFLRALDLRRGIGDKRGAAIESYSMGAIFEFQGRYGASVKSKQEALDTFRALKDRSYWMAEILSGYGSALAKAGRSGSALPSLDEALTLARQIPNQVLVAQTLMAQGDRLFYLGDLNGARPLFEQALQEASHTSDRYLILVAKVNVAKIAAAGQPSASLVTRLATLGAEADTAGVKYLSMECALYRAQVLVGQRQYAAARPELERLLGRSENLGSRTLEAKSQHMLATVLRGQGNTADARQHEVDTLRILEDMRKDDPDILKRADLGVVYAEATRSVQGG
jgi:tetratricopeptide (TPR) repeat protein/tRNA A-37 threonylcarbamoyl transferase component Bud32